MKTTAKWINENNYILNNSKYLNIAVSDPIKREDNYEFNCLDLVLMGFVGCITSEFKKQITENSIVLQGLETEAHIETLENSHPAFDLHVICNVKSSAKIKVLEECLEKAIDSSLPGILFKQAGIIIDSEIIATTPAQYVESFAG
ncbi:hypothetical protein ES708_26723 [subsurface metagenome]